MALDFLYVLVPDPANKQKPRLFREDILDELPDTEYAKFMRFISAHNDKILLAHVTARRLKRVGSLSDEDRMLSNWFTKAIHFVTKNFQSAVKDVGHAASVVGKDIGKVAQFIGRNVASAAKDIAKIAVKVGMAIPRAAYRTVLEFNVLGHARHLAQVIQKDGGEFQRKWESIGGNFHDVKKSIESGKNKKQLGEEDFFDVYDNGTLGIAPALAAVAAAAPIISMVAPLIKKFVGGEAAKAIDKFQAAVGCASSFAPGKDSSTPVAEGFLFDASDCAALFIDPTAPEHAGKFDMQPGQNDHPEILMNPPSDTPKYLLPLAAAAALLLLI